MATLEKEREARAKIAKWLGRMTLNHPLATRFMAGMVCPMMYVDSQMNLRELTVYNQYCGWIAVQVPHGRNGMPKDMMHYVSLIAPLIIKYEAPRVMHIELKEGYDSVEQVIDDYVDDYVSHEGRVALGRLIQPWTMSIDIKRFRQNFTEWYETVLE